MGYDFAAVERKWQDHWRQHKCFRALDPAEAGEMPKAFVLDMFPYPSGSGLHVGHPEGYTATDIYSRFLRMNGHNVLHPMGWDAFGLPAEQYAIKTGTHPAETTATNIDTFRRQIQSLGLSYDWDREVNTTDPSYYRWTQWIFLQLFNSYFDPFRQKAMPIGHLETELLNENLVVAPDGTVVTNRTTEGLEAISGELGIERLFRELSADEQRAVIDGQRLAYVDEVPVNWCPALGTVLSNEEVIDGRSEVGGFPVERRPMRQWMLRITAYADRLLADLDGLDWPESLKEMQRHWIGRSEGAEVDFQVLPAHGGADDPITAADEAEAGVTVFTTRPDTLFGATYMVLAPEHPLVDSITHHAQRGAVDAYRARSANRSERDRMVEAKEKTGVFTGAFAVNPVSGEEIPVWIADYVLMGYGTGAIMAVPAHDERDFEFAQKFDLPIKPVVRGTGVPPASAPSASSDSEREERGRVVSGTGVPPASAPSAPSEAEREERGRDARATALTDYGVAINSGFLDGLPTAEAKAKMIDHLADEGLGRRRTTYKLRDWLFSRQRYWGEPFPLLLDADGNARAVDEALLPVALPEMSDFKPTGTPEPPLSKAADWLSVTVDGEPLTRETNTMPQWAGSCWYYLRYIDPHNAERFVDPEKEAYWMPVDLYVGGVEHAVLHLLYARFWHKVLYDLDQVSTKEPFQRLVNQGLILGETEYHFFEVNGKGISAAEYKDIGEIATDAGPRLAGVHRQTGETVFATPIIEPLVEKRGEKYVTRANPEIAVDARSFKMSKSRGNVINPDSIVEEYGADTFRLYEMYMGPLEQQKPWNTRDIVGMFRFLNGVARNLLGETDDEGRETPAKVADAAVPEALDRSVNRTLKKVAEDIRGLRFNVGIAELIKLNNEFTKLDVVPTPVAETYALMLAPFAPHLAEEIWASLGHGESLSRAAWPAVDESKLVENSLTLPVQVNGKVRGRITVPSDADEEQVLSAAESSAEVGPWIEGKTVRKRIYVGGRMVNLVVS